MLMLHILMLNCCFALTRHSALLLIENDYGNDVEQNVSWFSFSSVFHY